MISDADGTYRGFDGAVHSVDAGTRPSTPNFSNWDIYRSQAQLTALIDPGGRSDMAQSIIDDYGRAAPSRSGAWTTGRPTSWSVISGMAVLADYYAFGATGFDTATALSAMTTEQTTDTNVTPGVTYLDSFGYLPTDSIYGCCHEYATTSTQLEYDIDDFALSVFAGALGNSSVASKFRTGRRTGKTSSTPPAATSSPGTPTAAGWTASTRT